MLEHYVLFLSCWVDYVITATVMLDFILSLRGSVGLSYQNS
jgi:hypothetical protein